MILNKLILITLLMFSLTAFSVRVFDEPYYTSDYFSTTLIGWEAKVKEAMGQYNCTLYLDALAWLGIAQEEDSDEDQPKEAWKCMVELSSE